jgi:hypothetical protein
MLVPVYQITCGGVGFGVLIAMDMKSSLNTTWSSESHSIGVAEEHAAFKCKVQE